MEKTSRVGGAHQIWESSNEQPVGEAHPTFERSKNMKAAKFLTLILAVPLLVQLGASGQTSPPDDQVPEGTAITYQGFLTNTAANVPINADSTFALDLWDGADQWDPDREGDRSRPQRRASATPPARRFWKTHGNPLAVPPLHFLGTGNNADLEIRSRGVGIGTATPDTKLHVNNNFGPEGLATFTHGGGAQVIDDATVMIGHTHNVMHGVSIRTSNNAGGDQDHASVWIENVGMGGLVFYGADQANDPDPFVIDHDGNVGIGTKKPAEKLHVCGNIRATGSITANVPGCPDYVFEPDYTLMPLDELEAYIDREKHLPNIPSAAEVEREGINLGEFQMRLLEKVEELVLYTLRQHKTILRQDQTIDKQAAGIADLSERLARMEALMTNLTIEKK